MIIYIYIYIMKLLRLMLRINFPFSTCSKLEQRSVINFY